MSETTERSADLGVAKRSSKLEVAVARSPALWSPMPTALQAVEDGHHACRWDEDSRSVNEATQFIGHVSE